VDYVPYTAPHVVTQLELLLFSGLAFFVMLSFLRRTLTITLDVDWLYRALVPSIVRGAACVWESARDAVRSTFVERLREPGLRLYRGRGLEAAVGRTSPTGSMALWMMVMLLAYLVLYYVV
jgi:multicomponent Na+:H+ antiporter subunit D